MVAMPICRLWSNKRLSEERLDPIALADRLADHPEQEWGWIDLTMSEADVLGELSRRLGFHALAVEDAFSEHERPKIVRYDTHYLLTVTESTATGDGRVQLTRLTAFLTPSVIITVRDEGFPIDRVERRLAENTQLAAYGVGTALWALLDVLIDDHIDTLEKLDDDVEELSNMLFEDRVDTTALQKRAFEYRRSIANMRHTVLPLREVVTTLNRRDQQVLHKKLQPYFADLYDHALHAADWTESLRDQVASVLETNVALQGNRMNAIMKKVTSWAAIIAVPTAITGYFGQNINFPGFQTDEGFWVSLALIIVASGALWLAFKRQDWL